MKFDHGIMVPLHHLTRAMTSPSYRQILTVGTTINFLHRAYAFGRLLTGCAEIRTDCHREREVFHWPATPDSGKLTKLGIVISRALV